MCRKFFRVVWSSNIMEFSYIWIIFTKFTTWKWYFWRVPAWENELSLTFVTIKSDLRIVWPPRLILLMPMDLKKLSRKIFDFKSFSKIFFSHCKSNRFLCQKVLFYIHFLLNPCISLEHHENHEKIATSALLML